MQAIHPSPFSGSWYPENAAELDQLLDECFERSHRRTGGYRLKNALGFVVPHAGPQYSGAVAAAVYRTIGELRPERIVVLGFPHHGGLGGVAIPDVEEIETPLGRVSIDAGALAGAFPGVREESLCDHSFEIQLPFLQRVAPGAAIIPLYVGRIDAEERRGAAIRIAAAWRPGTVFVASSDFTHYGPSFGYTPFPPDRTVARRLRELDFQCIEAAGSVDAGVFLEALREQGSTVCGSNPIALMLEVLGSLDRDAVYQSVLDYETSGDITGGYRNSVSYAALGYSRRDAFELEAPDREALLDAAAATLLRLRQTGERQPVRACGSAALEARHGIFVSLHQGGELLGCIGNCSDRDTLADRAGELAISAAVDDPRFRPAAQTHGPIDIEISVLTPFRRIGGPEQITAGRHGAALELGGRTALLLPQVAVEHDWTAEKFLQALARKGTMGPRAWRDPRARLYAFEAQVFSRAGRPAPL